MRVVKHRKPVWKSRVMMSVLAATIAVVVVLGLIRTTDRQGLGAAQPIRVGVLHSLSGSVAITERPIRDATLMAIEEINARGGLLGRRVEPVSVDGRSDWPTFAKGAERLISKDRVNAIFGGYTSASRKTIVPIIERLGHVLFYPTLYEGLESSPNVVYTGPAPNQFIIPAVKWFLDNRGKKIFLVGSDYVFPRSCNEIIKDQLSRLGGTVVGEEYMPLGEKKVKPVIKKILAAKPEVILSSVVGDTNIPFFQELRKAGVTARKLPTLSIVMAETELALLNADEMAGNYIALSYFQSVPNRANRRFVESFKRRFGRDRVISDPMEAAYVAVNLWAKAVKDAKSVAPADVLRAIRGQTYDAPEGRVYVDDENLHTWKRARIGQIRPDGQVDEVWTAETLVHPVPYSPTRTRREWEEMLQDLYTGWDNNWARP